MATGTVKWFSDDKGLASSPPMRRARISSSTHTGIIGEGTAPSPRAAKVSYEAEAGDKGPKAVNVQVI